jgi:hypothetical protein
MLIGNWVIIGVVPQTSHHDAEEALQEANTTKALMMLNP